MSDDEKTDWLAIGIGFLCLLACSGQRRYVVKKDCMGFRKGQIITQKQVDEAIAKLAQAEAEARDDDYDEGERVFEDDSCREPCYFNTRDCSREVKYCNCCGKPMCKNHQYNNWSTCHWDDN